MVPPGVEAGRTKQGRLLAGRLERSARRAGGRGRVDRGLVNSAKSFDEAVKLLEDLLPFYDGLAKVAALPPKECDARYPEFVRKAKADNPLAGYVLPSMDKVAAAERRARARVALFKAALAVVQGGPDKLKDVPGPFGDGPFESRALGKGLELKSKLLLANGQPATLVVGKGK